MRSLLRFLLTFLSSIVVASFLLCILYPGTLDSDTDPDRNPDGRSHHWFSFKDPTSLFSPTATISLTDDNSTFFNAKPAAFGPSLPSYGLSGPVWVGSGFGDDNVNQRGMASTFEGELGCADIPGWTDHDWPPTQSEGAAILKVSSGASSSLKYPTKRSSTHHLNIEQEHSSVHVRVDDDEDDGSDDNLHFPLPATHVMRSGDKRAQPFGDSHADIQSLQEAAEIQGKVVMLSRGGCGFSEKIKWAQRRGASAVIVADNVRGGPLVRMYARSDVSNITIPSIFTSHTTAHLLSHLIPSISDHDAVSSNVKSASTKQSAQHVAADKDDEDDAALVAITKLIDEVQLLSSIEDTKKETMDSGAIDHVQSPDNGLLSALGVPTRKHSHVSSQTSKSHSETGAPSRNWLRMIDFSDDEASWARERAKQQGGGFLIGKQDWRDPDVVRTGIDGKDTSTTSSSVQTAGTASAAKPRLKGGSITPGSGEYSKPGGNLVETQASHTALMTGRRTSAITSHQSTRASWFKRLFGRYSRHDDTHNRPAGDLPSSATTNVASQAASRAQGNQLDDQIPDEHVGLWVTLTPTDMNGSPFFNTLFVLVVSPLITLAVVYSMLLMRSRYRRRAWRAPKSIVERLPVRIYQALSSRGSPADEAPEQIVTATTPLLSSSRATDIPARPRSVVSSPAAASSSLPQTSSYGSVVISASAKQEKLAGLAEWKRKYEGKQRECVVCLEEYVDGVSRVMSLPCGHEFHVDCITPWLTTRRRTCPICKGDVVRSLTRKTPAAADDQPADIDGDEDEVQQQAAEATNRSPSAALPIPTMAPPPETDAEQGRSYTASYSGSPSPQPSWLSRSVTRGLDYFGVQHHDRDQPPLDRNR